MIVRIWRGSAAAGNAAAYHRHLAEQLFPALAGLPGHRGAHLLRRETGAGAEFLAVTLWASLDALRAFAGDDIEAAVIEPQAQAVLAEYDGFVRHFELVHSASCAR